MVVENPCWQFLCGFETMQHEPPLHQALMMKLKNRVGAEKLAEMQEENIAMAIREKHATKKELAQVNVDTTVQKKNITHPTDSKLYHKAIVMFGEAAKKRGVKLRQTYERFAKNHAIKASRYAHAKHLRSMRREIWKLRPKLERVV